MNNPTCAIDLRGVSFRYAPDAPLALDGVTTRVPNGAITAILGPNGSGKSTLLHVLLGLLPPIDGEVHIMGRRHNAYARRELSRIMGLVPQDEHVTFELSVLEYALLGRAPYLELLQLPRPQDRALAQRMLETVGIADLARRPVPSLSGGERQLATVARALTQEPRLLLLDEPTSHLDLANSRRVLRVLRSLCDEGRTIICTTHDPNAATAIADQVLLMREGRVVATGATHRVMTSRALGATYGIPIEVISVRGRPLVLNHDLGEANAPQPRRRHTEPIRSQWRRTQKHPTPSSVGPEGDHHGNHHKLGRPLATTGRDPLLQPGKGKRQGSR